MRLLLLILLLGAPLPALADPVTLIAYAAVYAGVSTYVVAGVLIARQIYGAASARRKARAAAARARAEYNASLTDRSVTALQAVPPWPVVYGRAVTGGYVVAILTSDKSGIRDDGATYIKPDALKHLVIVCAAHEVAAINEVYIDGVPVGALDGSGNATAGEFYRTRQDTRWYDFTTSFTAPETIVSVLRAYSTSGFGMERQSTEQTVTLTPPSTLSGPVGVAVTAVCVVQATASSVRVQKHLGTTSQTADSYLTGLLPSQWTSNDRLRGLAYCVVTLDLEDTRFQGGPPNITFDVTGKPLYDPRTGLTAWSANPALVLRDFLTSPYGYEVTAADIDDASVIVAANACDATISLTVGASTTTGPTYTCNGVFDTGASREAVLEDLCECMAGYAIYGAQWRLVPGMWTVPVMALTDDDLDGQIEIIQAGAGLDDLFNGIRGTYIPAGKATPVDMEPYQSAAFLAADGRELWTTITLPFTDNKARAKNLARIFTERARSSLVIRYPSKLRAWPLQVGDRVTVTSGEYGFTKKTFRVTDWQFALSAPVTLLLEEDVPGTYDLANAAVADPSPNSDLPNPWIVSAITGLTAASGTAQLVRRADGTINARIVVSWAAVADAYVTDGSGRIELLWSRSSSREWRQMNLPGDSTSAWIDDVLESEFVTIEVRAVNGLRVRGPSAFLNHLVVGKSAAPINVAGLAAALVPGGVQVTWTPSTDLDYSETEVRYGASWAAGTRIFRGTAAGFVWPAPAAGSYTLRARHIDTTGHESAADATASITLNATATVASLAATQIPGGVQVTWAANVALDYRETEVRYGASWAAGTTVFRGAAAGFVWSWPAFGTYTLRAKHRDILGNESASDTTTSITVDGSSLVDTGQLDVGAATEFAAVTPADGSHSSTGLGSSGTHVRDVATLSYTNTTGGSVTVEVFTSANWSCGGGANWKSTLYFRGDNDGVDISASSGNPFELVDDRVYAFTRTFTVANTKTINMKLSTGFKSSGGGTTGHVLMWTDAHLKYNVLKR